MRKTFPDFFRLSVQLACQLVVTHHFHQRNTQATENSKKRAHLSILMVNKDVPGAVVLQIGDLQAVGRADFCRLENGIDTIYLHCCFRLFGLQNEKNCGEVISFSSGLM